MGDALREAFDEAAKLSKKCVEKHFDNPKVSIIVPVYNVEPYIEECLDSLVGQTLKELEIIFIDDGSADNSLKIIQEYAKYDGRFVILTQKREGQGVGRNKCIEIAKGEYIAFVDPDDKIELNAMEELYNYAKSNNAQVVQFNYTRFGETIKTRLNDYAKKYRKAFGINLSKNNVFSWKDLKQENMLEKVEYSPCTRFYKTSFVKENQLKFAPTTNGEDQLFVIGMLFKAEKIHFLNKYFYHYRFRKGSAVNTKTDQNLCIFTNLELMEQFFKNENLLPELNFVLSYYKISRLKWHYNQLPRENLFDYLERVENYLTNDEYERFEKLTEYSFLQNIFSVRNEYIEGEKFKYLTILGFKIQLTSRNMEKI